MILTDKLPHPNQPPLLSLAFLPTTLHLLPASHQSNQPCFSIYNAQSTACFQTTYQMLPQQLQQFKSFQYLNNPALHKMLNFKIVCFFPLLFHFSDVNTIAKAILGFF